MKLELSSETVATKKKSVFCLFFKARLIQYLCWGMGHGELTYF